MFVNKDDFGLSFTLEFVNKDDVGLSFTFGFVQEIKKVRMKISSINTIIFFRLKSL